MLAPLLATDKASYLMGRLFRRTNAWDVLSPTRRVPAGVDRVCDLATPWLEAVTAVLSATLSRRFGCEVQKARVLTASAFLP